MRFTTKALAIAACAVTIGGIAAAGTADAATPSCGGSCIDVFSRDFGTHASPMFLMDVYKRGQAAGTPVILFGQSNADPAEDFTVAAQGTVADFYAAGLVSSSFALRYGCTLPAFPTCAGQSDLEAFEVEYAPYGADTGLCAGVAATAFSGEKVSLQPCGVSGKTVWAVDTEDPTGFAKFYLPAINGSDTNFSHPFVLTYPAGSFPADKPRPQLYVDNLTGFLTGAPETIESNQLWGADFGKAF
ncbi:MAG TPA: hypothetical protein VFB06_11515 [Streptosporangiaceae bacterium]|nr:hypothetical protein [Streptosporangiaceae bacterium]